MKLSSDEIEDLIISYGSTIRAISRRFFIAGGTTDDLYQEGMLGLFEAIKNYNQNDYKSDKFKAFARLCIKRQIYDAIKSANKKHNSPLNNYIPIVKINSDNQEYERDDILDFEDNYNPEDMFLDKEEHDEKISFIKSKLSDFEKQVLDLYLSGEKQSEIAKTLCKDVKSIDNTIQRIKNKAK